MAGEMLVVGSESESAGMTIREAGALGVPTIAIRNGGSDEQIIDGKTGVLVDYLIQLRQTIKTLVQDKNQLKLFGLEARKESRNNSSSLSVAEKFIALYK